MNQLDSISGRSICPKRPCKQLNSLSTSKTCSLLTVRQPYTSLMYPSCHTEPSPSIAASVFGRSSCSQHTHACETDPECVPRESPRPSATISSRVGPRLHYSARRNGTSYRSFCSRWTYSYLFRSWTLPCVRGLDSAAISSTVLLNLSRSPVILQQNLGFSTGTPLPVFRIQHPYGQRLHPAQPDTR